MPIHIIEAPSAPVPSTPESPRAAKPKPIRGMWQMAPSLRPSGQFTHRCAEGDEHSLEAAEAWRFPKEDDITLVGHNEYACMVERVYCTFESGVGSGKGAKRTRSVPGFKQAASDLNSAAEAWKSAGSSANLDALALALQNYAERLCVSDETMRGLDQHADEASEFFLYAWQKREGWAGQSTFVTWVSAVFRNWRLERFKGTHENPGLNFYRDDMQGLHSTVGKDNEGEDLYVADAASLLTDQQIEADHASYSAVREKIEHFDPMMRDVARLIGAGYQAQETCEIIGVSFKTYKKFKRQIEEALSPFAARRGKKKRSKPQSADVATTALEAA